MQYFDGSFRVPVLFHILFVAKDVIISYFTTVIMQVIEHLRDTAILKSIMGQRRACEKGLSNALVAWSYSAVSMLRYSLQSLKRAL